MEDNRGFENNEDNPPPADIKLEISAKDGEDIKDIKDAQNINDGKDIKCNLIVLMKPNML